MVKVPLKEICDKITDGSHNPPAGISSSPYLMISSKNISDDSISLDNPRYLSKVDFEIENQRTLVQPNDLLMTIVGTVGRVAVVPQGIGNLCLQRSVGVLKLKTDIVNPRFLMYQLQNMRPLLEQEAHGVAQKGIYLKQVEHLSIVVPNMIEQIYITHILDKISCVISLRKQQLTKLNELIKARFVEMFGDPVSNSIGWNISLLKNVTTKIGSGATPKGGKESYLTEGITLIRSMNVHDGHFEYKDLAHISESQATLLDNVEVFKNDVFINITGASVARSCIVPNNILPARVNQHVSIIRCKDDVFHHVFANQQFLSTTYKKKLLELGESGGATRQAITKQQLEELEVIVPPIELQKKFAEFVNRIEHSKLTVQQSLDKLGVLKKTLMQEYFG